VYVECVGVCGVCGSLICSVCCAESIIHAVCVALNPYVCWVCCSEWPYVCWVCCSEWCVYVECVVHSYPACFALTPSYVLRALQ